MTRKLVGLVTMIFLSFPSSLLASEERSFEYEILSHEDAPKEEINNYKVRIESISPQASHWHVFTGSVLAVSAGALSLLAWQSYALPQAEAAADGVLTYGFGFLVPEQVASLLSRGLLFGIGNATGISNALEKYKLLVMIYHELSLLKKSSWTWNDLATIAKKIGANPQILPLPT